MAINRLNLQIGGPSDDEHKEVRKMEEQIDVSIDQLLSEEFGDVVELVDPEAQFLEEMVIPQPAPELPADWLPEAKPELYLREHAQEEPEKPKTRQELMAETMSRYHKATKLDLSEADPLSNDQRIKLLEDAYAQMKRGQPNTLVSGIGASLDSGGGAVWLWDLEDVNIGVPLNGTYPTITDGDALVYNATTKK